MRMCGRVLVLMVMQLTTLVGYASTADNPPPSDDRIINLPVKFLGFDGKELLPSMRPNHLSLDLYSIPGKFSGDTHQQFESVYRSATQKDIEVEGAGWTWVQTKSTGPSTFVDVRAASPHPVLLIAPIAGYQKYLDGLN
jgi:hypothetical protein